MDDVQLLALAQVSAAGPGAGRAQLPLFPSRPWLGPQTDAVLARYEVDGAAAQLLLGQYLDAEAAATGFEALQVAGGDNLVAARSEGNLLGAVFGQADAALADELLSETLGPR